MSTSTHMRPRASIDPVQSLTRRALAGVALPLALTACSGAATSDLFTTPPASTATGQSSPPQTIDAGEAAAPDSGARPSIPPPPPPDDAGPGAPPPTPDSGPPPVDQPNDAAPSGSRVPARGRPRRQIDDGSWPGDNASIPSRSAGASGAGDVFNDGASVQSPAAAGPFGPFLTQKPPNGTAGYVRTVGPSLSESSAWDIDRASLGSGASDFDLDESPMRNSGSRVRRQCRGLRGILFLGPHGRHEQDPVDSVQRSDDRDGVAPRRRIPRSVPVPAPEAAGTWTKVSVVAFTSLTQPSWTLPSEELPFDVTSVLTLRSGISAPVGTRSLASTWRLATSSSGERGALPSVGLRGSRSLGMGALPVADESILFVAATPRPHPRKRQRRRSPGRFQGRQGGPPCRREPRPRR